MFHCNCKWTETVLGLILLIVTIWPTLLGATASMWVVIVAAVVLILHAWCCGCCGSCMHDEMPKKRKR